MFRVDISASMLAQHFVQAYRSDRQVSYKSPNRDSDFRKQHIILHAFATVGGGESIPGEHTIDQLQRMACII